MPKLEGPMGDFHGVSMSQNEKSLSQIVKRDRVNPLKFSGSSRSAMSNGSPT
jgi:hypothetical protein